MRSQRLGPSPRERGKELLEEKRLNYVCVEATLTTCVWEMKNTRNTTDYTHTILKAHTWKFPRQVSVCVAADSTWWVNKTRTAYRVLNRAVISIQTVCPDLWTTRSQYLSRAVILWIIHRDHLWWAHLQPTINLFYLQRRGWSVVPALHKNGIFSSPASLR